MKKTLLKSMLVAGMLAIGLGAQAQVPEGKVYIKNVQTGLWWGAANEWGTHASLIPHADFVTLAQTPEGLYTMETQVSNGGENYYFAGDYMDGAATGLSIEPSGQYYTIALNGAYFGTDGNTLGNGTQILGKDIQGDAANWQIFTEEEMIASLGEASVSSPVDATFLIIDHTFGRNHRAQNNRTQNDKGDGTGVWSVSEDCTNYNLVGGNSNKHSAESYHSVYTVQQTIENVPNGVYAFTAQGFYRQDGTDNDNLPYFFINGETANIPLKTGTENSMAEACTSFEAGNYKISPLFIEVTDGTINLGVANPNNANLWCIWDNFELTYYGENANIDQLKNAALFEEVAALVEQAQALIGQVSSLDSRLNDAIAAGQSAATADEANAAKEALKEIIALVEGYKNAQEVLPLMKQLTESTNVYTQEAYDNYYGTWIAKYEDGTLTADEAKALQNPYVVTAWHANVTCDNFLLSAWDTNPDFQNAAYYINTWSVEGDSDGSNFHVPFFEYWTGDGESLGERTLTATMNVAPGTYNVSAWVRVRIKNGAEAPAYGITLQANDGEAVDVAAGEKVGESQFYLKEYTAQGVVGEDGVLYIKFIVAADNNISWLSFQNVKFEVAPFEFPEGAVVYDFAAEQELIAAGTITKPSNLNGSAANGQAFYGWENSGKTDSKRQDYKGYGKVDGSVLPDVCHVWRRSDRFDQDASWTNVGGLTCPNDREMAVDGLQADSKVIIVYDATNATDKEIVWAIGDGTSEGGPGAPRATATINDVEAVTGETTIASGAEIVVKSVTPAEKGTGYIVFQVKKGMVIKQIGVIGGVTTGIATVNTVNQQNDAIYDLQGRRVAQPVKGLYIINGKKVVVK